MVRALTAALQLVDLDHPQAIKSVHAILRPLEILTRAWPKRPAAVAAAAPGAAAEGGTAGAAGAAEADAAGAGTAGGAAAAVGPGAGGVPAATPAGEAPEAGRQVSLRGTWNGSPTKAACAPSGVLDGTACLSKHGCRCELRQRQPRCLRPSVQALRAAEAALENLGRDRARAERRSSEPPARLLACPAPMICHATQSCLHGALHNCSAFEHCSSRWVPAAAPGHN